ncbi:DEAD/DEAH box helicase family protein [Aeromonas veronii]|uniref:DEAD/DEAH box helicase family protein n=1 Tax=Aeromonas veronii TaxID=654 RepID=UPI003B9E4044
MAEFKGGIMLQLNPIYFPNEVNISNELFLPIAKVAKSFDCMSGYFSSSMLRELARPLAIIFKSNIKCRMIISPYLSDDDRRAIIETYENKESLLRYLINVVDCDISDFELKTIYMLQYLLLTNKLEIKFAVLRSGLFHTKAWIFQTDDGPIALHGSSNATLSGLSMNFEQICVSQSVSDVNSKVVCVELQDRFDTYWSGNIENTIVFGLNQKTIDSIKNIKSDNSIKSMSYEEIEQAFSNKCKNDDFLTNVDDFLTNADDRLIIPDWYEYESGNYSHQGEALNAWLNSPNRGILSIATGGGKTLTSLLCASISLKDSPALVVIAVPTSPLIEQWALDVRKFKIEPFVANGIGNRAISVELKSIAREVRLSNKVKVVIITHDALTNTGVFDALKNIKCRKFLIADEVHNLGAESFVNTPPTFFDYALGLSATPIRQYDETGSEKLLSYFGGVIYDFPLERAIGTCLTPYEYYIHPVYLNSNETEEWLALSDKIKKNYWKAESGDDSYTNLMLIKRKAIIESAENKILALKSVIETYGIESKTLIFTTDKNPTQLDNVNALMRELNVRYHQITAEETRDKKNIASIIYDFSQGKTQVITSKRVLDEGFNIPDVSIAYFIASSSVKRQWIQRMGRVLRKSEGKSKAIIHDFVVIPPAGVIDKTIISIIDGEISRVEEMSRLSLNQLSEKESYNVISELLKIKEAL